jgi:RND family efflux transporter MFP subunit
VKTAVIALLVALAAAGCTSVIEQPPTESTPVTVTLARAAVTDIASAFEAGGIVRARATAQIASRVLAPIAAVHVRPGDHVRRGAPLVTLDARDIQANEGRAEAASLSAVEEARAADADLRAAESAVVLARASHDRMAALHAKRSATPQELDQATAGLQAAEAQRASAQARLAASEAARTAARASAEVAAITATYSVLSAPFDGVVAERHADPGSMATPGSPLLVVEDPTIYRLEVQLDESRAALAQVGQTVSVRLDNTAATGGGWVDARIAEIGRVDPASHSFLTKIDLPPSGKLRSGLFGRARLLGARREGLTAPASALIRRGQLTFVYLVDADGRARLRPISPGSASDDRVEVLAGLRDGDVIVIDAPASLTDGTRVSGGLP